MREIKVSELAIYPVKSLRQIMLNNILIDSLGFKFDRRWMVVDENRRMITQRKKSRMCLIQPILERDSLTLQAVGMPDIKISRSLNSSRQLVTVWEDNCMAEDCGNEAAEWLSKFLETDCRLFFFPEDEFRQVDTHFAQAGERIAFSDGFPILLISQASLDDLNQRLSVPVAMHRFRPNLVVSGCESFAEDNWKMIRIGELNFRIVKPCSRCIIPNIDPDSGRKSAEPTRTLSTFRRRENKIFFGQNVIANGEGQLETGMSVEIVE
ncbi:Flavodoxin reductases (ferredoxin-NADPH reductases) family 1 [hydrothermal vent metagenome]|uniref:Flavodoxin reductases (Ferredoxin-NADPH reductases) family 1 n=1 Tax=hydrothermal vent metagenome TaxID=652676 RepID=A0A3B1AXU8_9ZZZZ